MMPLKLFLLLLIISITCTCHCLSKKSTSKKSTEINEDITNKLNIKIETKSNKQLAADIQNYLRNIECLCVDFVQHDQNGNDSIGKMWILKGKKRNNIRIDYQGTTNTRILIKQDIIKIINLNKNKIEQTINVSQTPFYTFLNGDKSIFDEKYEIENLEEYVSIKISKIYFCTTTNITLFFSKYDNGNIRDMLGWVIQDSQGGTTIVKFAPETLIVNDRRKVYASLFVEK